MSLTDRVRQSWGDARLYAPDHELLADIATLEARCAALAKIVRQSAEWSGPDTGLCWALVPEHEPSRGVCRPGYEPYRNPCTHPGCIERRALIGDQP